MSTNTSSSSHGIGFFGALFLLFLGLKLGGVVDWDWLWVFSPLWGPLAFVFAILAAMGLFVWFCAMWVGRR